MTEGYQEENGWMERKAAVVASGKERGALSIRFYSLHL